MFHTSFFRKLVQNHSFLLWCLVIAFGMRLYGLTNPVADWHAFRQADTASVTREYVKRGINLLEPKYHDLSNIQSGQDNLEGYRMVEFPFVNGSIALLVRSLPFLDLVVLSRFTSVLASIGTLVTLYFFLRAVADDRTAKLSAIVFALMPFAVYYSRVILPEPFMLFFSMLSLLGFVYWLRTNSILWYATSVTSLALALLLKPFVVFMAPVYLALLWFEDGWKAIKRWQLVPYGILAVAPFWWWRDWISNYPSGIPASDWLFNSDGIRFRPAWFRWLFFERLTKLILGWTGVLFLVANVFSFNKQTWIFGFWWLGMLAYLAVFATGNVRHDYYQVLLIPIIVISIARGFWILHDSLSAFLKNDQLLQSFKASLLLPLLLLGSSLLLSWQQLKGYYNINHWEYIRAGKAVDENTPADALVIAPAFGDTQFLFQTNRLGWPIGFEIDQKISKGATHYITTTMDDEANELLLQYQTIVQTDEYLLLDLTQPRTE